MRLVIWIAALWTIALPGCGGEAAPGGGAGERGVVRVVATLPSLAWPAEAALGEGAEVTVLLPPGASPHGFELSPSDAAALREADLVLTAGGADDWVTRALELGDPRVLAIGAGADHHPWLDPEAYARFAARAGERLAEIAGEGGGSSIDAALAPAAEARERAERAASGSAVLVVTGHDAWSAFFSSIGIADVTAVRRGHAGEPAASTLVEVRRRAAEADAVLVVLEPGDGSGRLESLAEETGAVVVTLDPVGTRDWPGDMAARFLAVEAALEALR